MGNTENSNQPPPVTPNLPPSNNQSYIITYDVPEESAINDQSYYYKPPTGESLLRVPEEPPPGVLDTISSTLSQAGTQFTEVGKIISDIHQNQVAPVLIKTGNGVENFFLDLWANDGRREQTLTSPSPEEPPLVHLPIHQDDMSFIVFKDPLSQSEFTLIDKSSEN